MQLKQQHPSLNNPVRTRTDPHSFLDLDAAAALARRSTWGDWKLVVDGNDGHVLFGRTNATAVQDRDNGGVTVAASGTAGEYIYTFNTPRGELDYTVQVTPGAVGAAFAAAYSFTVDDFKVRMYNSAGTNVDTAHAYAIHLLV